MTKRRVAERGSGRGATLIEVVIAGVILSAVIVGSTRTTITSRRTGDASRFETEATTLAMDKLEELRARLPLHPDLTPGSHSDPSPLRPNGTAGGIYTRTWEITSNLPILGMSRIAMRVAWPAQLGARSVLLVSTFSVL